MVGDVYVSVTPPPGGTAEVGVTLSPDHQGRGLATEAVGAVVHLLIRAAMVDRVQAFVDARNAPSLALFERLGFRRVEVLRTAPDGDDEILLETSAAGWPRKEPVR